MIFTIGVYFLAGVYFSFYRDVFVVWKGYIGSAIWKQSFDVYSFHVLNIGV